jgi:hypothetical protein
MLLEIPGPILRFLREVVFESGHEPDAYLSPSIFEDIMDVIMETKTALIEEATLDGDKVIEEKITAFVSQLCDTVGHLLCYDAAWKSGNYHSAATVEMASLDTLPSSIITKYHSIFDRSFTTNTERLESRLGYVQRPRGKCNCPSTMSFILTDKSY